MYQFGFPEVALGQYLGVGGMTLIAQIVPIMKGIFDFKSKLLKGSTFNENIFCLKWKK